MSFPFATRTLSSTVAQHLDDHNTVADMLVRTPFTVTSTRAEHLAEHNALHPDFGLPTRVLGDSATLHLADHDNIHANIIQTYAGPRTAVGPRDWTGYPGYPGSFNATVSQGPTTIQNALSAQPIGAKIRVLPGTYNITSIIGSQFKANQELWFDAGAEITNGASLQYGIQPTGVDGVKIMGATVSGFTTTNGAGINPFNCDNWEIAFCEVFNCYWNIAVTAGSGLKTTNMWVHNNVSYSPGAGGVFTAQRMDDSTWEDNEWGPGGGNNKLLGTTNCLFRYNWCHDTNRSGVWYDTGTTSNRTEWNLIEGTGFNAPMAAVCYEICRWIEGAGGVEMTTTTRNHVRHNWVKNNYDAGILIRSSTWTEVYRNLFQTNLINTSNPGEVDLTHQHLVDGAGNTFELANNHIHNNIVTPSSSGRRAMRIQVTADGPSVPSTDPYLITNVKDNNFDFNRYDLVDVNHAAFAWPFGTNKTFAQWQAVPQGPSGTGATQDINGERV